MRIAVRAPAKINLSLDIVGKREDGYHLLETIMQSVSLFDYVSVEVNPGKSGINVTCSDPLIPVDKRNIAYVAAGKFVQAAEVEAGIDIHIKKIIPTEAGLAGGSADGAAVLYALDQMFAHRLSKDRLFRIAAATGADVPFCLQGGTVFCRGIGEELTVLADLASIPLLLVKPEAGLSTALVYQEMRSAEISVRPDTPQVIAAITSHDLEKLAACTANVLEMASQRLHPDIAAIKREVQATGAVLAMMSGSGPAVFGLYNDAEARDEALNSLAVRLPGTRIIPASTISHGPETVNDKNMDQW